MIMIDLPADKGSFQRVALFTKTSIYFNIHFKGFPSVRQILRKKTKNLRKCVANNKCKMTSSEFENEKNGGMVAPKTQ